MNPRDAELDAEQRAEVWREADVEERTDIACSLLWNQSHEYPNTGAPRECQHAATHVYMLHDDRRKLLKIVGRLVWSDDGYSSTDYDRRDNELLIEAFDTWRETK